MEASDNIEGTELAFFLNIKIGIQLFKAPTTSATENMSPKLGVTNSGMCQNLTFSRNVPLAPVEVLTFNNSIFSFWTQTWSQHCPSKQARLTLPYWGLWHCSHTPTKYHFQWLVKNWRNVLKKRTIIPRCKIRMDQFSFVLLFKAVVLKISSTSELPGELALGSHLQSSVGLGWDLRICISNTLRFTIQKNTGTNSKYVKLKIFWQAK